MNDFPQCFVDLMEAWNLKDASKARPLLEASLAPDILFADPTNLIKGIDAFEAMVKEFRAANPEAHCVRASGYQEQNNRYRYKWLFTLSEGVAVKGMDVSHVNEDGLICRIDAFFGDLPPAT